VSLLTAIQQAWSELLPGSAPTFIIGNLDPQVIQFLALATREAREMMSLETEDGGWQQLRKEYRFNLHAVGPYTGDISTTSKTVTAMSSVAGISATTYAVQGTNLPQAAYVTAVGTTTIDISDYPQANVTGVSLTFGQVAYPLPSDLQFFLAQTQWDRAFRWQMVGPLDAQQWQILQSGLMPSGPRIRWRIYNNLFWVNPIPSITQTDTIAYEYISNSFCTSAAGMALTAWTADTDTYVWDQNVLELGLKWRFLRAKGLDFSIELKTWQDALMRLMARSSANTALPMNASAGRMRLLSSSNIQDGNYPST
jgi:hypothetical protein